jgi:4-alpha-glucanotransferase
LNRKLAQLAKLYGVQTSYIDMRRKERKASPESLLLVLRALGAPVERFEDVDEALRERQSDIRRRPVEPVMLAWNGNLRPSDVRLPGRSRPTLVLENGETSTWPPRRLPSGYHRLNVESRGRVHESLVISAPVRAHFPLNEPSWGVFAPVYALHSERSFGAGDLTDLGSVVDWMQKLGGRVAATLPLLSNFTEEPCDPSPYSPCSRIFWNEFYIDPARAPEMEHSAEARRLANSAPSLALTLVDYRVVMAIKRPIIEALAQTFFSEGSDSRRDCFAAFLQQHPAVEEYARFRAVTDRRRAGWTSWPERLRNGVIRNDDYDEDVRRYYLYAQWLMQEQMQRLADRVQKPGGSLYLDLPLGLHKDSYDTWRHRDFFVTGVAGGAPPDPVFTVGQNWGFPPMHPPAMRANRHQYTIAFIRNHLRYARLLRIDHVMGLHRLYWIPDGLSGAQGVYVEYPAEEFYAILSLESHRNKAGIVGENLGTVPLEVNASMKRHNIRQMYVVQYEIVEGGRRATLRKPPLGSVASLNTHDMPPFKAFLEGDDIPDRLDLNFLDAEGAQQERGRRAQLRTALSKFLGQKSPEGILNSCFGFLGKSRAGIVLVNLEDLWQEINPQNVPATTSDQRPNWRRRMRYSVDELRKSGKFTTLLKTLNTFRNTAE